MWFPWANQSSSKVQEDQGSWWRVEYKEDPVEDQGNWRGEENEKEDAQEEDEDTV